MQCNKHKCIYLDECECEELGTECIGDMCENFGECVTCQEQDRDECDGLK